MTQERFKLTSREKRYAQKSIEDGKRYLIHILSMQRFKRPWNDLSPYQQCTVILMLKYIQKILNRPVKH